MRANLFKIFAAALITLLMAATAQAHVHKSHAATEHAKNVIGAIISAEHANNIAKNDDTDAITTAETLDAVNGQDILTVAGSTSVTGGAYVEVMEAATPVVPMDDMPSNVPEPSTFALLSLAAIGLIRSRRHA